MEHISSAALAARKELPSGGRPPQTQDLKEIWKAFEPLKKFSAIPRFMETYSYQLYESGRLTDYSETLQICKKSHKRADSKYHDFRTNLLTV